MNPNETPIENQNVENTPVENKADEVPSWAQALIDQNADLTNRLTAFEEKLTPVEEPAPEPENNEEWKPSSWQDVQAKAREEAEAIIEAREAEQRYAQEQEANTAKQIDDMLDNQVAELTKEAKLPAVVNENDPNDPGKLAQRELYGFALSLGTADLKSSFNTLDALHKAGKQFDFVKMELVDKAPSMAGADSPVGSSSSGTSNVSTKLDYKTIHNTSLDALAARFTE